MTPVLDAAQRRFLAEQRAATLATVSPDGRPRLVPICYVLGEHDDQIGRPLIYTPLDEKAKTTADPHQLARVRDILVLPHVSLLAHRWSEDWSQLAWLRASGLGQLLEPQPHEVEEHAMAVAALREKYPQYREQAIDARPIIRISIDAALSWGAIG